MISFLKKKIKTLNHGDVGLIKLSVAAFTLFVITLWSAAMTWVHSVNTWYFFVVTLLFGARPFYKYYMK